jgi:CheY-like chemotaxis protein
MNRVINILLIEDDNLDVIDLRRTLDKMSVFYKMKIAKNGEEGVALLKQKEHELFVGKPDVILLDINMPRMNGIEFLQLLRSDDEWKDIKVFVLTTSEENEDKKAVKNLGISGYITKPFKANNPGSIDAFNLMIDLMNMQN